MSERKYNCKDVDMLVTSSVVMGNFNQHKDQLLLKRKTWVDPFAPNLEEKIDHGLDILGINTKIEQTTTTRQLVTRQKHAMNQLATFKVQLEVDFEDDPDTLKQLEDKLGFSRHYNQVRSGDQEALIQLLAALKQNVSPEVKTQIKDAGTDIAIIDELITMRDEINEINIKQESLKGSTPKDTALNIEEMNDIYKAVIGICKIAPRLLQHVPTASEDFSFAKILSRLHA